MRSIGCPPGVNSNVILVSICLRTVHLLATLNGYTSNCDIQFTFSQIHMFIAWLFTAHYFKYIGCFKFQTLKKFRHFFYGIYCVILEHRTFGGGTVKKHPVSTFMISYFPLWWQKVLRSRFMEVVHKAEIVWTKFWRQLPTMQPVLNTQLHNTA